MGSQAITSIPNPFSRMLTPFGEVSAPKMWAITLAWLFAFFGSWGVYAVTGTTHLFPTPDLVWKGFVGLWNEGLVTHLVASLGLCLKAIGIATLVSLSFAYVSTLPLLRPLSVLLTKFRYLPLTGISFYLGIVIDDARTLQTWILVTFMATFLTTGLIAMIESIPEEEHHHARALGHSRWRVLWDVVIRGRIDYAFEIVRQNLAIAWMMLVTVETIVAASGGIGFLIKNGDKFTNHGRVVALQIIILLLGLSLDWIINKTRKIAFPYSRL